MKKKIIPSLILLFLYSHAFVAQHISEFESLDPLGQDPNFHLPSTHTFQPLLEPEELVFPGRTTDYIVDFTGYVPIGNSSSYGYLSINSESVLGAVTILDIELDATIGKWIINDSQRVDFSSLVGTIANCSGTVTAWGTVITCEEYTSIEMEANTRYRFPKDSNEDGFHDFGWAIEIDPETKKVIDQDGDGNPDKLWEMGNFKHENAVIHSNNRTVYQGADDTKGEGFLFKFVANTATKLSIGDLYVYKGDKSGDGNWLLLDNKSKDSANATLAQCNRLGATNFGGIEDVEINPIDGMVYFAVKKEDVGVENDKGVIYRFTDVNTLNGSGVKNFELYAGGDISYDGVEWGNGTDNLVFDDRGNLWVAQDESGADARNYIWVIYNGHTQNSPKVKIFARTPYKSEPTGLTFSPDYKYIFMSIQHPSTTNLTSQKDAFGESKTFNKNVTLVVARDEHLNANLLSGKNDIIISQIYHDETSNSKWIELKNISSSTIEEGSYFISRYENSSAIDPVFSESIPSMVKDEVLLLKNQNPTMPDSNSLGSATQKKSEICDFDEDDIILISTSGGVFSHSNRLDVINVDGNNPSINVNSGIRKDIATVSKKNYEEGDWIHMNNLEKTNSTSPNTNLALGTHEHGKLIWNGTNWNMFTIPDLTRTVEINGAFNANDGRISVFDLTVNAPINFENGNSESIVVYNNLVLNDILTLGDQQSLVMYNDKLDAVNGSGIIRKIERSSLRNDIHDITYWSAPVKDGIIEEIFVGIDPNRIFYYDASKEGTSDPVEFWTNAIGTETMLEGAGYAAEGPKTNGFHEVIFSGKPNNGNYYYSLKGNVSDSDLSNDFNLIGNPYPSAIHIDSFFALNKTKIDPAAYFWTHASAYDEDLNTYSVSDYAVYNYTGATKVGNIPPNANVGSGQGFFVRAISNDDIKFENSMRMEDANTQFFKSKENKNTELVKDRIWLDIHTDRGNANQILIGFLDQATDSIDSGYDAYSFKGGNPIGFYSLIKNLKFKIQGRSRFSENQLVKIGFDNNLGDSKIKISINELEGVIKESEIYLIDKELNTLHNMKSSPYSFEVKEIGEFPNRLELVFKNTALNVDEIESKKDFKIHYQNDRILIRSSSLIEKINVYDILGRLLIVENVNSKEVILPSDQITAGTILIIASTFQDNTIISKKTIKF